ncbi:hypothetical protein HRI_004409800 [Hibiscus trionum]|uniref:Uncharacterized protein n=1 Tax=Hibiscus trionum TaxID=183268 RepID=A0A9W7MSA0_HIBTR|nr:hypothetical protein HRI_004409800 [Hibiscus trionum]
MSWKSYVDKHLMYDIEGQNQRLTAAAIIAATTVAFGPRATSSPSLIAARSTTSWRISTRRATSPQQAYTSGCKVHSDSGRAWCYYS